MGLRLYSEKGQIGSTRMKVSKAAMPAWKARTVVSMDPEDDVGEVVLEIPPRLVKVWSPQGQAQTSYPHRPLLRPFLWLLLK